MAQDQESGRRAAAWGLQTATQIAGIIGATKLRKGSNECLFEGRRVVIKCAHKRNAYVGVLSQILGRLDEIIGAFERPDGAFDLLRMSRDEYLRWMRTSKSSSHVPDRGQQVRRKDFEEHGTSFRTIRL
jgi:hypothetical protein